MPWKGWEVQFHFTCYPSLKVAQLSAKKDSLSQQFLPWEKVRAEWVYGFSACRRLSTSPSPHSYHGKDQHGWIVWRKIEEQMDRGSRKLLHGSQKPATDATDWLADSSTRPTHEPHRTLHLQPPPTDQCIPAALQYVLATRYASLQRQCAHTPPNGTHKPCHLHTHIPMDSTQILAAAQLCRIDRKNTTLNTSGHCPGKNKWEALSTHPDFAGLRKGKNILRLLP